MDNSEDEMEEDDAEWKSSFAESAAPASPASAAAAAASGSSLSGTPASARRVVLHFDLDCFYAQVEMIRNPALRDVPLGIQQKYIIVTCNYVARQHGVTKLMSVTDAKEKCPQLVLVKGEDLTHYREMSYRVTELLSSFCPLVERLGFDENYVDVTEMVDRRLAQTLESTVSFEGHVYNNATARAGDHPRLAAGSRIAAELREAIHGKLGLTGCAGIATNKLLAKLVSGTFKPNQQTTLLPENVGEVMSRLSGPRKVPGVGHQTAKRLQALGVVSVRDLQLFPLADLAREFGSAGSQRLRNLALGVDDSPVTPTGAPQSLSDEDSFKKMTSTKDVVEKIQQLLTSLVERMHKDGRHPQTFRLTIRRYSATNKWFSRESRQCPIPNHVGQKISSGSSDEALVQLVSLATKLFHKMVDARAAFHLTLINVCFSNLQTRGAAPGGRGSITSFFTPSTSPKKTQTFSSQSQDDSAGSWGGHCADHQSSTPSKATRLPSQTTTKSPVHVCRREQGASTPTEVPELQSASPSRAPRSGPGETAGDAMHRVPPDVDPEVFRLLPEEIQEELLSLADGNCAAVAPETAPSVSPAAPVGDYITPGSASLRRRPPSKPLPQPPPHSQSVQEGKKAVNESDPSHSAAAAVSHQWPPGATSVSGESAVTELPLSFPWSSDCEFPVNVDPYVFAELPSDVQKELLAEWKQKKPVLKSPAARTRGRGLLAKDKKASGKSRQANSLLNYFKPS